MTRRFIRGNYGFVLGLVLLLTICSFSYYSTARLRESNQWVVHTLEALGLLEDLQGSLTEAESARRGFVITHDDSHLTTYRAAVQHVAQLLEEIGAKLKDNSQQQQQLLFLAPLVERKLHQLESSVVYAQQHPQDNAEQIARTLHGKQVMDQTVALLAEMKATERELLRVRRDTSARDATQFSLFILLGSLASFLAVGWAAWVTNRDIRLEQRVSGELKLARDQAEMANQAKSTFLANMSHEIRTPMTAILGFTDILLEQRQERQLTAEDINSLQIVKKNASNLLQIINDILDLSKIEAGRFEVERTECSPAQIAADVVSLMRVRADAKKLPLHVEFEGPLPRTIKTDPLRLRQILVNLVGNAIKFTEMGEVRLRVGLRTQDSKVARLQFDVQDTGIGMTDEQLTQVFQPFMQADASVTRRFGGTGLGLTISRRLARLLGGDLAATSRRDQGSTFSFWLPAGDSAQLELINPVGEAGLHLEKKERERARPLPQLHCRVLLAEDGPDNQRLIAFHLRKAGAEVTVVENGQLAIDQALDAQARRLPFDVILMDMQMPVLDGYSATRLLRGRGYRGPIIALTAHAMEGDQEKCLQAGCDGYASKPIDRARLLEVVTESLSRPETVINSGSDCK